MRRKGNTELYMKTYHAKDIYEHLSIIRKYIYIMFTTSSSEIGHSSMPDLKYQKTIKEIGKLVNINTALKK